MNALRITANSVRSTMKIRVLSGALLAALLFLFGAAASDAAELKEDTVQAWDAYIRSINSNMAGRGTGGGAFLWVDSSPDLGPRVRRGEVLVAGHDLRVVPHGLIHHWVGAMFIPNATLDEVRGVLDDYVHYPDFYRPIVAKSKLVERTDDCEKVTLLMVQKAFSVTGAVQADEEIQTIQLDADKMYSFTRSVHAQEIANYGRADERLLPEGRGPGYVWRMFGITRLEQRDDGVYVEMETIALSRGIPVEFRWLIKPLTEKLPRNIMFEMLNDTGAAVKQAMESVSNKNQGIAQNRVMLRK
jgi:hypothetical protein